MAVDFAPAMCSAAGAIAPARFVMAGFDSRTGITSIGAITATRRIIIPTHIAAGSSGLIMVRAASATTATTIAGITGDFRIVSTGESRKGG
jgi:hypothetical protein